MLKYFLGPDTDSMAEELAEEMSLHIQEKAEALEDSGLSPEDALAAARRAFGNQAVLQEQTIAVWKGGFISSLAFDLRTAAIQLCRFPLLAITAIAIIAIGIGANTAAFSALYAASFKSLTVTDPKSLVFLSLVGPHTTSTGVNLTPRLFSKLEAHGGEFAGIAGSVTDRVVVQGGRPETASLTAAFVSDSYFGLLGIDPLLGRTFRSRESDAAPSSKLWPVVLDYRFWKSDFQGRSTVIGERIRIAGASGIIVGIMPETFDGLSPGSPPRLYLPIRFLFDSDGNADTPLIGGGAAPVVRVVGRLRQGVDLSEANANLKDFNTREVALEIAPHLRTQPYLEGASIKVFDGSQGTRALDEYRDILAVLQALMAAALLLCCLNVTALQLALAYERAHEFALRVALGANRVHLVRQCFCEAFLLAMSGAVLSVPIPLVVAQVLPRYLTRAGSADSPVLHVDWATYAAAGLIVLLVTVIVGIVPALLAARMHPAAVLKTRSALGRPPFMLGRILVVIQFSVAFVLLSASTFLAVQNHDLRTRGLGFRPEHVVEVTAQFQWLPLSNTDLMALYRKMLHRLAAEKDIEAATLTWITPLTGSGVEILAAASADRSQFHQLAFNQVGPSYFTTLRTGLLQGREFSDEDDDTSHCILNSLAAKSLFPLGSALGATVNTEPSGEFQFTCKVIGIAADAKYADVHAHAVPTLYVPITSTSLSKGGYQNNMVFLIRAEDYRTIASAYQDVLRTFAPTTSYMRLLPMSVQLDQALGRDELLGNALTMFTLIALPLCAASLLGLLSIRVKRNAVDIAIRVALGAPPFYVARAVLQEAFLLLAIGSTLGLASILVVAQIFPAAHLPPYRLGLLSIACAAALLIVLTFCTAGVPAMQAARLKPMRLLCRDS